MPVPHFAFSPSLYQTLSISYLHLGAHKRGRCLAVIHRDARGSILMAATHRNQAPKWRRYLEAKVGRKKEENKQCISTFGL